MIRLDKFLSDAGAGTRSEIKRQIKKGLVTVNSAVSARPEQKIDPDTDRVCVMGKQIKAFSFSYYLFHKPSGCVTARRDARDRTVMDYFPEELRKLSPVGRLDKDTEGVVLLTDDGMLNHRLTSPAYHFAKTYYAILDGPVPKNAVSLFAEGVDIGDEKPTLPAKLSILPVVTENGTPVYSAELTITEGRFHQVKRMFQAEGCQVIYLKRLSFGPLELGELLPGDYRSLESSEVELLFRESGLVKDKGCLG